MALVAATAAAPGATVAPPDRPTATSHKDAQQRDVIAADRRRRQQRLAEAQHEALAWAACLTRWKYPKPGYSVKQGQRMAAKARNKARSK